MVVRHGRVTDVAQSDMAGLLRDILQQQTAMLQVQAESVRLQRVLVERLLGVSEQHGDPPDPTASRTPTPAPTPTPARTPAPAAAAAPPVTTPRIAPEAPPSQPTFEQASELPPAAAASDLPFAPAPADQLPVRGARYYQSRPSPTSRSIAPDELELLRRLQEMRDAGDLILQFGPHKGSTLAQVAMSNPAYIRELMTRAKRPEVRAAAGRLVQALDAAAEHKPKLRTSARRGRPAR